ncbi:hypothetical protein PHLGIDRAFT_70021 [Phlebiopsis gigantea 11061_1 CR5-6]|uniref:NAD(P)-binding protein n=1 Tax=Phlebiopsis gigantea (strain 11061_1 CR5-6) TaxID=745531 RepID=A0A0C3S019_PHLG1|nr:hypothetical protein PHLGIDRAFT_70021 [Phlebiopsis gigantea 11061_1 CR5-6]
MLRVLVPPTPTFFAKDMPDLTGRVVIVTGGNTGIGKETVKALLEHNAKVYLAARSRAKAEAAIADLKTATGKEAIFLELDLSSLASVRRAAEEFLSKEHELHVLFNNAGVMWCPLDQFTTEGYDMQWGTNVVGHFFLTELLVLALAAGAKTSPDGHARVVTTSSSGAYFASGLQWETFKAHPNRHKMGPKALYFQSKLGNAIVAREGARRYGDKSILCYAVDPGSIKTELQRHASAFEKFAMRYLLYPAPYGALTQLWAGVMPETLQLNGEFLVPYARLGRCRAEMYDPRLGEQLWTHLKEQVKDH